MTTRLILRDDPPELLADLNASVAKINGMHAQLADANARILADTVPAAQQRAVVLDELRTRTIICKLSDGQSYTIEALDGDTITYSPFYGKAFTRPVAAEDISLMYAGALARVASQVEIADEIAAGERNTLGLRRGVGGATGTYRVSKRQMREMR